ncbi:hypothetical protein M378DRAFT_311322 [Amanita muscaria Koide BX008]|uniref:OBG-type G domain-containing protein n=1 Tax=Amanita muscaria (strain Koide BX008) TaxID=946122 RepID=A0A0C2SWZ0_AMAMK|nr:hypothetical protein M378DRAFT_311322 [Amanita muscaria Koide BX008]
MSTSGLKAIAPVPTAAEFLDIVLSKTQRKTPTVIHKNFKISRIRNFYMRKVKFTQDAFDEKLEAILTEFPILDDLHPFLSSLMNVLYDKNHYKLALGQLRTARHLIDQVSKDYVRLLKFGDSLYRCKQLKRAALGRMATIMRRQKDPLAYLEQVRQHISRLPAIDPNTRTLIICGYPNVGKSSFINKVTRADVDVQPYAFTTKSLFVGHMDYKYLRWQVIDTPGILDHPLEEMNTIEMQSITALAHLKAAVLYFMDLSEQCGYTVEAQVHIPARMSNYMRSNIRPQCKLFQSIKPLFSNKPTLLITNKIDVMRLSELPPETQTYVKEILESDSSTKLVEVSCHSDEGVMELKTTACDALLAHRIETKMKGTKINSIINRIHVAQPKPRDEVERLPFIPDAIKQRKKYDRDDPDRRKLLRDREVEEGGAGVFNINLKEDYLLKNPEWKSDIIPEIMNGKNIADFIDPDIAEKLEALEREEERLEAEGYYESEDEGMYDSFDEEETRQGKAALENKMRSQSLKKAQKNKSRLPRTATLRNLSELSEEMRKAGLDPSSIEERAKWLVKMSEAKQQHAKRKRGEYEEEEMDVDYSGSEEDWQDEDRTMDVDEEEEGGPRKRKRTDAGAVAPAKRVPASNRNLAGLKDMDVGFSISLHFPFSLLIHSQQQAAKANRLRNLGQRGRNRLAKAGEGDRAIRTKMPKHLFAGKRKMGKTSRR